MNKAGEAELAEMVLRAHQLNQLSNRAVQAEEDGDEELSETLYAEAEAFARAHNLIEEPPDAAEIPADAQ